MAKYRVYINEGGVFGLGGPINTCGVIYIGYSEENSTEIKLERGRVLIPCDEPQYRIWQKQLKEYTVLHIEAEKDGNTFHVTQMLENGATPTEAEAAFLEEQQRPVTFTDDTFGTFTQNKRLDWFEGSMLYNGNPIEVTLDMAEDIATLHSLYEDLDGFLQKAGQYAAEKMLDLANDWCLDAWMNDGGKEEDYKPLTHAGFIDRLTLQSIGLTEENRYSLWYDDGDMFWGHSVHVGGSLKDGFTYANMEG